MVVGGGLDASVLVSVAHWTVLGVVLDVNLSSRIEHTLCGVQSLLHKCHLAILLPQSRPGTEIFPEFRRQDLFFENYSGGEFHFFWALCTCVNNALGALFPSVCLDVDLGDFDGAFLALVSSLGGGRIARSEELAAGHAGADFDANGAFLGLEAGDRVQVLSALACGLKSFLRLRGSGQTLLVSSGVRSFCFLFCVWLAGISLNLGFFNLGQLGVQGWEFYFEVRISHD